MKKILITLLIATTFLYCFGARRIDTQIVINATPFQVWQVLSDTANYPAWNSFIQKFEGSLLAGHRLRVTIAPDGKSGMEFAPTMLIAEPAKHAAWRGVLGVRGLFDGEHHFELEAQEDGTTLFKQYEEFSGILVPLSWPWVGESTKSGFERMNKELKQRVEAGC